jgi:hypothetical protein
MMRVLLLAAAAVGAMVTISTMSTSAEARDYPFCMKGEHYLGGLGDCSFETYQQCQASASGRRAYCDANPYFGYSDRSSRPRRHFY